jgi:predicted amidophosphoribosyltransferase
MTASSICPTCGQPLPQARGRRVCSDCKQPIRLHDKWFIGHDGMLHRKDCANPSLYPIEPVPTPLAPSTLFTSTPTQGEFACK